MLNILQKRKQTLNRVRQYLTTAMFNINFTLLCNFVLFPFTPWFISCAQRLFGLHWSTPGTARRTTGRYHTESSSATGRFGFFLFFLNAFSFVLSSSQIPVLNGRISIWLTVWTSGFLSGSMMKKKLLVDVDCGVDDAQAIMLALAAPTVKLLGITCVHGNTTVENVCKNTLRVLQACNRLEVMYFLI